MAEEKKKKKKWWIIVVVVVVIIIAVAGGNSGKEGDSNPKKVAEVGNSNSQDDSNKDSKKKDEKETKVQTEFKKGDVLETKNLRVTYKDCGEYKDYNEYSAPADGNKIIYATFEFENISDTDQVISSYEFSCYADGYDCQEYYYANQERLDATLSAGKKTKGTMLYEVPKDAKSINLEYEVSFWNSDKITFVVE